jgi:prephenate dehydratase/chorismate mutase/prephenate dehydratase
MNLTQIRNRIDLIDSEILRLLNRRIEWALVEKKMKDKMVCHKKGKRAPVKTKVFSTALTHDGFMETIYGQILKESMKVQIKDLELMAFQGEHGAFGEVAAKIWKAELIPIPCREFSDVFEGVQSGIFDYGIVPVENSLGGAVEQVNRLLINTELNIVGSVALPIHLSLLSPPGANHREIHSVYSHPQALSQCRQFLARNELEPVPFSDTAGAAKMLSETAPKRAAAIASSLCAELYGLDIIKENVEDLDRNLTRFLVLSTGVNLEEGDKCSIVFCSEHKAGALFNVLKVFAGKDINLTRIESIPNEPGDYAFFLDFEGSNREPRVVEALREVEEMTASLRIMGCYTERKVR